MRRRLRAWHALFLLLFTGCLGNDETGKTALSEDNRPNACTLLDATSLVFGPAEFRRATGKPQTETAGFEVPSRGEVCVLVTNGSGDPPHGERISAAWLSIDGAQILGPDAFSQVTGDISALHAVEEGPHRLSVKLASVPGSFISVEIRFLPEDTEPPVISIEPADGAVLDTDLPLLRVAYHNGGVGVDLESLRIELNGSDATSRFQVGATEAIWQVGIDDYLEEGRNDLSVLLADLAAKATAARALGLTLNERALVYIDEFVEGGLRNPSMPEDCSAIENRDRQMVEDYFDGRPENGGAPTPSPSIFRSAWTPARWTLTGWKTFCEYTG